MERVIKETLARVYVGEDPGRRVCEGMIGVGDVVSMDAAIWFSDLRGFTTISEGLGVEQLLDRLNAYFDCVVGAIYEQGGEVLKYIGDAVLAVFPVEQHGSRQKACLAALNAARISDSRLAALNAERAGAGNPELAHGIGLHLGEVRYGNIGSRERLDFTVIGREVNIASRIEGVCKQLREPLICSRGFAEQAGIAARPLGPFDLKGVAEPVHLCVPEQSA
jgi:adenylate cyclase